MFIILFYLTTFLFYQFYLKFFLYYYRTAHINTCELNHKPYFPHIKFFLISFELTLKRNTNPQSAKPLLFDFLLNPSFHVTVNSNNARNTKPYVL